MASNPDARTFTANPTGRRNHRGEASMSVRVGAYTLTKTGASRYDWRDPYHIAISLGWPGFLAMFVVAELSINVIFALLYLAQPGSIANARPGAFSDAFFFSLETLATVGYGAMSPGTLYGHCISAVEIISGLAFIAIMTGLTFVRFSRARAKILYAEKAVIAQYNGKPTLMIRIANARHNTISQATARLWLFRVESTKEREQLRRYYELQLERSEHPIFSLSWTLLHVIDETSPFHGLTAEDFAAVDGALILNVGGVDDNSAQRLYARQIYSGPDIRWHHRYRDITSVSKDGRLVLDYTRFHDVTPETS